MVESISGALEAILGLSVGEDEINPIQILFRALIVYAVTVALVQMGSRRFLGRASVFDSIIAIMLASLMSRAVTVSAPILQTFAAGASLIGLYWLIWFNSFHTSSFGAIVKGDPIQLIKGGKLQSEQMRKAQISEKDL